MNNLHRELAPISDAAWAEIEEETARTLKRYLAGRRVIDMPAAAGVGLAAVGTGHLRRIEAPTDGISARLRESKTCFTPSERRKSRFASLPAVAKTSAP